MQSPNPPQSPTDVPAGLLRRLGAVLYDGMLLLAVLMIATAAFLPLTGGEALDPDAQPALEFVYRAVLVMLIVGYFGIFWTRRGQTLGMASWRLRIERDDGAALGWRDTALRLAAAVLSWLPFGLGYLWIAIDPQRRAWHDRLSGTRILLVPKGNDRG
jgi:uncharacterized RDD family membrane protein YckC